MKIADSLERRHDVQNSDHELDLVVRGITAGLSLDDALAGILRAVERLVAASSASILLAEPDGSIGPRRFTTRTTGEPHWDDHASYRPGGITLTVLQTGATISIDDTSRDPRTIDIAQASRPSIAAVPIRGNDKVLGVLYVNWQQSHVTIPTEVALLERLADFGAIAIENSRLHALEIEARREAVEAHQKLQRLLATVAHDLEGPLTLIVAYEELLRSTTHSNALEVARRALPGIEGAARRIRRLVNDLLIVSEIGAQRFEIVRAPADLAVVLREVVEQQQLQSAAHRLQLSMPPSIPGNWDIRRITEVFTNLVSNAVKFSLDGGDIQIEAEESADLVTVRIIDEGIGIAPHEIPRLFQPFSQLDAEPTTRGVGLGLYISKVIVDLHDGQIRVDSSGERGSVFTVVLPRR
ncbi:MAG TPA: ATP-binding protein [Chloroflexota bacterium]|nr:ATP-binding protein [Chloroflexota bacterium]